MATRILIRIEANSKIGFGHFYRCLSLANMLNDTFEITFGLSEVPSELEKLLAEQGFSVLPLGPVSYESFVDDFQNEIAFDLKDLPEGFSCIILDGYGFGLKYQRAIVEMGLKCVVIEDGGGGTFAAHMVINHAPGLDVGSYEGLTDCEYLLGPDYALLRPEFQSAARVQQSRSANWEKVLLCFGGADLKDLSTRVATLLLTGTESVVNVIIPSSSSQMSTLIKLKAAYADRLYLYSDLSAREMLEQILHCELAIVPSSGILFECIAAQRMIISGYTIDNQRNIYEGFKALNAFIDAGRFEADELRKALEKINREQNINQKVIDGLSPERYLEAFEKLLIA